MAKRIVLKAGDYCFPILNPVISFPDEVEKSLDFFRKYIRLRQENDCYAYDLDVNTIEMRKDVFLYSVKFTLGNGYWVQSPIYAFSNVKFDDFFQSFTFPLEWWKKGEFKGKEYDIQSPEWGCVLKPCEWFDGKMPIQEYSGIANYNGSIHKFGVYLDR